MSEMPERKVLKELLMKLKAKAIRSEEIFEEKVTSSIEVFEKNVQQANKFARDRKGDTVSMGMFTISNLLLDELHSLVQCSIILFDDLKLYIESLEKYSGELDKTLWDAIEQAKKEAQEKIKQQKELMKKKSPETYRV